MRYLPSQDVPRPGDTSAQCVTRMEIGHHHGYLDLIEALEREGEPRAGVAQALLEHAVDHIQSVHPQSLHLATEIATSMQLLYLNLYRLMKDDDLETTCVRARELYERYRKRMTPA